MQRLNTAMMARYEIDDHRPARVNAVQFGMGEALLGAVGRVIDAANAQLPPDARMGVACVQAGEAGFAKLLSEQDGLYTLIVRGYEADAPVHRELVAQHILRAVDPLTEGSALEALAADPEIGRCVLDCDSPEALALARRFLDARRAAGLPAPEWLCAGGRVPDFLAGASAFPALADSLVFRSEAGEAARLCREMNYADAMIHVAEPFVRLTVRAGADLASRWPLAGAILTDARGFGRAQALRSGVFDGGLFLMAAAGWLNGCDTLRDCMTHERLRRFVGEGFMDELLPALAQSGIDRGALEAAVIESFARWENPLNRNPILRAAGGLIPRFRAGILPLMRRWADERFEPPRRLAFALAATIMLYAGARPNPDTGRYEVARGRQAQPLDDGAEVLALFATLAHDMPPEALAYAALADRGLWNGADLREIDGLEARVALDIAAMQRDPAFLPEA